MSLSVLLFDLVNFTRNIPPNPFPLAPIKAGPNRLDDRRQPVAITGVRARDWPLTHCPSAGTDARAQYNRKSLPIFHWGDYPIEKQDAWPIMWTLFGWWKTVRSINSIYISSVLSCTTVLKLFSTLQTFRQLFIYSCLKYSELLFMIFTLQTASHFCDLNSGYSLHFHTFNTARPSRNLTYAKLRVKVYRKIMLQLQFSAVKLCHITLFFSHTQQHINMSCPQCWSLVTFNLYIRQ